MTSLANRTRSKNAVTQGRKGSVHVWRWPAALAVLSFFGLLSALLGQGGLWWLLSWISLAIPLLVIVRYVWWRSKRAQL